MISSQSLHHHKMPHQTSQYAGKVSNVELAPGLLPVLQTLVALRFALVLLGGGLLIFAVNSSISHHAPSDKALWMAGVVFTETTLLLILVMWPALRERLGALFLPVTLGWLLLSPLAMDILITFTGASGAMAHTGREALAGVGIESVWMAAPVVLAAWQYGRKGWLWAMGALVASAVFFGLLLLSKDVYEFAGFALSGLARLGAIGLLGWVTMRLASSLQSEHQSLLEANRRLMQRAATIEQLAESRERNRLARELHDTLAHSLTGVSVQLQALDTLMQYDPAAAEIQLKETQTTVREGIRESRRAIEALRATPLEDLGLSEALRQLCRKYGELTGLDFHCDIDDAQALDPLTEQAIYRVAEAALSNVVKHAAATEVSVRLMTKPVLRLDITDDGVGFDPATTPTHRYGLAGMAERAELLGATLVIESAPGRGTTIVMTIEGRDMSHNLPPVS
jgi:signal transduction histidine kinase